MGITGFDPIQYWKERHVRYSGDIRSVGHIGKSLNENNLGTALISDKLRNLIRCLFTTTTELQVLDLACGIGRFAPMLTETGFQYTGVDISAVGLEHAKRACPVGNFIEVDVTSFQPKRRYDLVLSLNFLIHVIKDSSWNAALNVITDALSPQGFCILMDDIPEARHRPAVHVVQRSRDEYERALAQRGLVFEDTQFKSTYLITPLHI